MSEISSLQISEVLERDLSAFNDYTRVVDSVGKCVGQFKDANKAFSYLGRSGLRELIENASVDTARNLKELQPALRDRSSIIIFHNTGVDQCADEAAQLLSISLAALYGEPTKTDRKLEQIAWPIRYDPVTTVTKTFSQSLGEAAFHTDTQYFASPEEYFGLFCINADTPDKGTSEFISAAAIAEAYKAEYGEMGFSVLSRPFPFKVPSVFTETGSDKDVEIIWAPIFTKDTNIRYRKDTIKAAIDAANIDLDDAGIEALERVEDVIRGIEPIRYHLQPGDAVLVNNLKLLHARSAFDDPDRFLYRVRMRDDNAV